MVDQIVAHLVEHLDAIEARRFASLRTFWTELRPSPLLLRDVVRRQVQHLHIWTRGMIGSCFHGRGDHHRCTGLRPSRQVVEVVVLAKAIHGVLSGGFGPGEEHQHSALHLLSEMFAAGMVVGVRLAFQRASNAALSSRKRAIRSTDHVAAILAEWSRRWIPAASLRRRCGSGAFVREAARDEYIAAAATITLATTTGIAWISSP